MSFFVFTCMKLKYYMLPKKVLIICNIDIVKYLLNKPVLQERLMMWAIKFHAFSLNYVLLKVIKGQALADFLAKRLCVEISDPFSKMSNYVQLKPWILTLDINV